MVQVEIISTAMAAAVHPELGEQTQVGLQGENIRQQEAAQAERQTHKFLEEGLEEAAQVLDLFRIHPPIIGICQAIILPLAQHKPVFAASTAATQISCYKEVIKWEKF